MPSIILVRHGPVALKASGLFSYGAFCRFIETYEQSCLAPDVKPPEELIRLLRPTTHIFASDAPRVTDTLCRLGLKADVTDQSFREAPPLAPRLPIKLPIIGWLALARARGVVDPALKAERDDLQRRSAACAERLILATASGPAALVGHGWFNRHVVTELIANGWRKTGGPGFAKPFGYVTLTHDA